MANLTAHKALLSLLLIINIIQLISALPAVDIDGISIRTLPLSVKPRIVNGQNSAPGQFPHQALLKIRTTQGYAICGGSLLTNVWIITAAHCAISGIDFEVHLGAVSFRNTSEPGRIIVTATTKIIHPAYDSQIAGNDLALIRLDSPVQFTDRIQPVKLPTSTSGDFVGANVIASGWGLQFTDALDVAQQLQWAPLHIISNRVCARTYGSFVIQRYIICAQGTSIESVCNGDSGKRLLIDLDFQLFAKQNQNFKI